jgi:HTH-type transcriptional regulator / antitoxin HigA
LNLQKYDKQKFNNILQDIKRLSFDQPSDFATRLQEICASCGVAVVYTRNLPKASISGATRWQNNKPIIQLSGRYKTNDHFWFTFYHEAGHILLHGKKDFFLEDVEESLVISKKKKKPIDLRKGGYSRINREKNLLIMDFHQKTLNIWLKNLTCIIHASSFG